MPLIPSAEDLLEERVLRRIEEKNREKRLSQAKAFLDRVNAPGRPASAEGEGDKPEETGDVEAAEKEAVVAETAPVQLAKEGEFPISTTQPDAVSPEVAASPTLPEIQGSATEEPAPQPAGGGVVAQVESATLPDVADSSGSEAEPAGTEIDEGVGGGDGASAGGGAQKRRGIRLKPLATK
ncbi:MAG: hypothetical protein HQL63_07215 [Magnetococcales bacterium]|nr:hypothetical protein [Magnetococcales bacterium]